MRIICVSVIEGDQSGFKPLKDSLRDNAAVSSFEFDQVPVKQRQGRVPNPWLDTAVLHLFGSRTDRCLPGQVIACRVFSR